MLKVLVGEYHRTCFYSSMQSLLLLHYLVRNGSERVVTNAREHVYDMKLLEEYTFRDEHGKDQGINGECKAAKVKRH